MAKTVNQFSTIEDFRQKYNELAIDVGDKSGLRTTNSSTLVDAVNSLEDKSFFFQEFVYVATAGQTVFSGDDSFGNSLEFRSNRIQVFKNAGHLVEGEDFTISGASGNTHTIITLTSSATVSDKLVIYSFTGSYLGTSIGAGSGVAGQFAETAANTIYNINDSGVILNGDGAPSQTTTLQTGFNIQLAGKTYAEDNIELASGKSFVGNLTGNVTGNLIGNVTGNLTGNSATATSLETPRSISLGGDLTGSASFNGTSDISITATIADDSHNHVVSNIDDFDAESFNNIETSLSHANHTNITASRVGDELRLSASASYSDTDARNAISGGDGLTYNSSTGAMVTNTSNGIVINSDNVELDYQIVSSAPTVVGGTSTGHLWFVI